MIGKSVHYTFGHSSRQSDRGHRPTRAARAYQHLRDPRRLLQTFNAFERWYELCAFCGAFLGWGFATFQALRMAWVCVGALPAHGPARPHAGGSRLGRADRVCPGGAGPAGSRLRPSHTRGADLRGWFVSLRSPSIEDWVRMLAVLPYSTVQKTPALVAISTES